MRQFLLVPIVAALAAAVAPAEAAITLKLSGYQVGSTIGTGAADSASNALLSQTMQWQVTALGTQAAIQNGDQVKDIAGQFGGTIDLGDGAGSKSFTAYCVELTQTFNPFPTNTLTYTAQAGSSYFSSTINSNISKLYSEGIVFDTAQKTAAFQIALWEVIYEKSGTFGVGDGSQTGNADFTTYAGSTANAATFALAQSYLNAIATTTNKVSLTVYANATSQDLIVATPIPEPATYALMVAGLVGIGFAGLRRSRQG